MMVLLFGLLEVLNNLVCMCHPVLALGTLFSTTRASWALWSDIFTILSGSLPSSVLGVRGAYAPYAYEVLAFP